MVWGAAISGWCLAAEGPGRIVVVVEGEKGAATEAAVRRLREVGGAVGAEVVERGAGRGEAGAGDLVVVLGEGRSGMLKGAGDDSYVIETVSASPLTVVASGVNGRGTLYAAYRVADLLKARADLGQLEIFTRPRVAERYVSFGATTHGRREYRPELYWKTLGELPRYGYNGVVIYPGGGTPIGRRASPVVETEDGGLALEPENTARWREWLGKVDAYGVGIMMTVPPVVPAGYERKAIRDYYAGGPEPEGYLKNLRGHFRRYLELLREGYPEVDRYLFNSTEGATFGRNERFFGHPAPERYPVEAYLRNNEAVMRAYFEELTGFFGEDIDKVYFWTHSFGLTSDGIRRMREVLFAYPGVTIVEDDFWNNNLWPYELPAMAYLPEDLRRRVSAGPNPFALFQIATDGEYFGGGSLPNAWPGSHVRTAEEAVGRGARMVIQRLDLHDRTEYGTAFGTMEIVPLAASRRLWEPVAGTDEVWREWAERRFGREAAADVVAALKESRAVIVKGLSCNGIDLLGVGSEFNPRLWKRNESRYTRFHLFGRPGRLLVEKGEGEAVTSEEFTAYQMKTRTIAIGDFERDQGEAMGAVRRGLARVEKARPHLAAGDYEMLKGVFENGERVLTGVRLLGRAAYAANLVLENFDRVEDPRGMFREAIGEVEAYLKEGKLSEPMAKNVGEIVESYRAIGRGW
jgi:hypothetical protein